MDRHARKRITSKISNFLWSTFVTILLIVVGYWLFQNVVFPWLSEMNNVM